MKATELRIGNLIYWNIPEKKEVLHTVVGIYKNKPQTIPISLGNNMNAYLPIPITEEFIIKLGFELFSEYSIGTGYIIKKNGYSGIITIRKNNLNQFYYLYGIGNISILNYVHQLQNLYFALTGNELTYEKD